MTKGWMKKTGVILVVVFLGLQMAVPVFALELRTSEKSGSRPGLLRNVLDRRGKAVIGSGTLTAKNGNTLTVTQGTTSYSVLVDTATQLRRRFWGKASLDEMAVGDVLNIIGKWTNDVHSTVQATLIRDASIQKRFGVFIGTVQTVTSEGWTMQTGRGMETVVVASSTKLVNRKEQTITKNDAKIGHKVRVRGLWDNKVNTITEVSNVKDYSLPLAPMLK